MRKPKKPYDVKQYLIQREEGAEYSRDLQGTYRTWAVSEAQAISNIMHRLGISTYDLYSEGYGGYNREIVFEAVEA